jgi:hypothetical protein
MQPTRVTSVPIVVMTQAQAVNMMITEVCPNEDERPFFLAAAPIKSDLPIIHEYHDCQRLIDNGAYGPVVGIFAHRNVDTAQTWQSYRDGKLAAVIVNFVTKGEELPYGPLGIAPGTACLILRARGPEDWQAAIVNQSQPLRIRGGRQYASCADNMTWRNVAAQSVPLVVKRQKGVDLKGDTIVPPTARWDWDSEHRINYIGVKCDATTWCEIGPSGFVPSVPLQNGARQDVIKGYYDQQYLAAQGGDRVSNVFATIMPGSDAKDAKTIKHRIPRWYRVAYIELHETPQNGGGAAQFDFYLRKFFANVNVGTVASRRASGELRIRPKNILTRYTDYHGEIYGKSDTTWNVKFRWHPSAVVKAATVRWRWDAKDETAWSYCDPAGCCELAGTFQS